MALAPHADPEGRVSDPKGHASEKRTRFSGFDDALSKEWSIGSDAKSGSTFGSDALEKPIQNI
jgi:hypothetical protein